MTEKLNVDSDCENCFKGTKGKIGDIIDHIQCTRAEITPEKMCRSAVKKLGCSAHNDDMCHLNVRNQEFSVRHDALCKAAEVIVQSYTKG